MFVKIILQIKAYLYNIFQVNPQIKVYYFLTIIDFVVTNVESLDLNVDCLKKRH